MSTPLLLLALYYLLTAIGIYLLFRKAGVPGWKAFVPIYRSFVMLSVSNRPRYWALLQFVPIVGLCFTIAIAVEFIRTFRKTGADRPAQRSGATWVWVFAGVITFLFLPLLRFFVYDLYTIPTGSMEKTFLRGDLILVNKLSYGPRTGISPYHRLFSGPVGRGDILVFNFPEGDTVVNLPDYQSMRPFYEVIRELGRGNADSGRQIVLDNPDQYPLAIRPVDKREAYVKRCVAIPGDTVEIRNQVIYIDGQPQPSPPESETYWHIVINGPQPDEAYMKEQWGVDINNTDEFYATNKFNEYNVLLTQDMREKMLKDGFTRSIVADIDTSTEGVWPNDTLHHWTRDNYGALWVPRKGASLQLTPTNYSIYERVIRTYEGNKLEMRNGSIYINGRKTNSYTFKMNYYWVIGDNLHGSQDSRYWGFVPEDHVIGKAWMILGSWGKGMRWNRLFKKVD